MALILREADVKQVIEMDAVIAALEAAMRELGEAKAQNEPRRRAFAPAGLLNGKFEWERAIELASVLAGRWKAPDQPGVRLFESHGLALWDLAVGSVVLAAARERRLGEEIDLFV